MRMYVSTCTADFFPGWGQEPTSYLKKQTKKILFLAGIGWPGGGQEPPFAPPPFADAHAATDIT
jgi:hypothetical protein